MKKLSLLFTCLVTACGGSGGSGGSNLNPSPHSQNQYVEERVLAPHDSSRFDYGCKAPGSLYGETVLNIDKRLKSGTSYTAAISSIDEEGAAKKVVYSNQVIARTATAVETNHKIISSEGFLANTLLSETATYCEEKDQTILCHSKPFYYELSQQVHNFTEHCSFDLKQRVSSISSGTYYFKSSKPVKAFKQKIIWPGEIECDGKFVENGEFVEEVVYSNEVPALRFSYAACGGEKIFDKTMLKGSSGKIYWIKMNEVLSYQ